MARPPHGSLVRVFNASADTSKILKDTTSDTASYPKRPPVHERATNDLKGDALADYINGLESRLIRHMCKSAPLWHARETRKILERWNVPQSHHPAPNWAVSRDRIRDARVYAAELLAGRVSERLNRLGSVRHSHGLNIRVPADTALHLTFNRQARYTQN